MKKILVLISILLLVIIIGGFVQKERKEIINNSFQPADKNYEFISEKDLEKEKNKKTDKENGVISSNISTEEIPVQPILVERIEGIITAINIPFDCYPDEDTPTTLNLNNGKKIIIDKCNSSGEVKGMTPNITEINQGYTVSAYVVKTELNTYSIFGSNDYFVNILELSQPMDLGYEFIE